MAVTSRETPAWFTHIAADGAVPDLTQCKDATVDVFALESIERWDATGAAAVVEQIHRVLRPGGLLRVATPDLDAAVHDYLHLSIVGQPSRGSRLNAWWRGSSGRSYLYNEEDLTALLRRAGFVDIRRFIAGASSDRAFWGFEDPDPALLVLESRRPTGQA